MSVAAATSSTAARPRYGSMSRDRRWAMRWSYFFLVLFAIFFLTPPIYMFITSLKTSAEISAATSPWWVYNPTLSNYIELLTSSQYLGYFRNSAIVDALLSTLEEQSERVAPPPLRGRVREGGESLASDNPGASDEILPPSLTLPLKGGGDHCIDVMRTISHRRWRE